GFGARARHDHQNLFAARRVTPHIEGEPSTTGGALNPELRTAESAQRSAPVPLADRARPEHRFSLLAEGLIGSPILKIATEVRALIAQGAKICNLTVGDFAPSEFPVPELLSRELAQAVMHGETNYPPSTGMPALKKAVAEFCARRLDLRAKPEDVLIAAGARPLIYAAYRVLVDP